MTQETYLEARDLQVALAYLKQVKAELETPATQNVIVLKKRQQPTAPPAQLTTALNSVESFLLAQAVTAIDDQIDALETTFANL